VSTTLTFLTPLKYCAPTNPVAYVYWVEFPGDDLLHPVYHAYKIDSASQAKTEIGLYQTLAAAQSACQTDYTGPQTLTHAPQTLYA
jgi:hypothetical protein